MITLVKELAGTFGPSSHEEEVRGLIRSRIAPYVDEVHTDALGNLIAVKKGPGKRIMLAAHMDEIGVVAAYVDEKGFIRFSNMGGVSPFIAAGQRIVFGNGTVGAVCYEETLEEMKGFRKDTTNYLESEFEMIKRKLNAIENALSREGITV